MFVKSITFYNWTKKDFVHSYAKTPYMFKAGKRYSVPEDVAVHFAKHLAIRECHDQKDDALPKFKIDEYTAKCFPASKPSYETYSTEEISDAPLAENPQEFEEILTSVNPPIEMTEVKEPSITPAVEKTVENVKSTPVESTPVKTAPKKRGRPAKTETKEEQYLNQ